MNTICINILLQNTANVTVANISDLRNYITNKLPNCKVTWCPDNNFVFPGNKDDENVLISSYLGLGDDLAMGDGFPAVDHNLIDFKASVDEFWTSSFTRFGKTPIVATAWHYPATYLNYLSEKGVKIVTGTVWSQTGVDRFQGEGSRLFPYFPSVANSFVPGQTVATTQDILVCNSLGPDTLGCRVLNGDSRWTLHPADPDSSSSDTQKHIIDQALLNNNYPLFVYVEIDWLYTSPGTLSTRFKETIDYISSKEIQVLNMSEYNEYYRENFNYNTEFGMVFSGSGISYGNSESNANLKQYWYENKYCSVCIQENLTTHNKTIECCLNYIEGTTESYGYFEFEGTLYKDWSYRTGKSYKFDQFGVYFDREIYKHVQSAKKFFNI